jgi:DNA recombination protein RmuC
MNDLLVALAVLFTGIAAVAAIAAALRAGRPTPPDQSTAIQAAQLAAMVQGLVEQSNRDRESVQQALAAGAKGTTEQLQQVGERLGIIDRAQQQIEELKGQVVDLVGILGSNQARGAFGEVRLEQIVEDVLPAELYEFQATLSNRARVDCLIRFSERGGDLAVDSKFPLESYRSMLAAGDDATRIVVERQFKVDVKKHIDDISSKYLIKGETRDLALMFIPAESIYSELLQHFSDLVEYSSKKRVYLTSPNTIHGWLTNLRSV